jgi:hypothetical protein
MRCISLAPLLCLQEEAPAKNKTQRDLGEKHQGHGSTARSRRREREKDGGEEPCDLLWAAIAIAIACVLWKQEFVLFGEDDDEEQVTGKRRPFTGPFHTCPDNKSETRTLGL